MSIDHCLSGRFAFTILATVLTIPVHAQTVQERISGENYVTWAKDQTGLSHYSSAGVMCVVHAPKCGGSGHNGKDHYFAAKLPAGVTVDHVDFKVYWPNSSIDHTDRGGVGSTGSYGASLSRSSHPPLADVHWENACELPWPSGKDWTRLAVTYQISFLVSHPKTVKLNNPSVSASTPVSDACAMADRPYRPISGSTGTTPAPAPQGQAILVMSGPNYSPLNPKIGTMFTATIAIRNVGTKASPSINVNFLLDGTQSSATTVGPIAAGGSAPVHTTFDGLVEGTHELEWKIVQTGGDLGAQLAVFDQP